MTDDKEALAAPRNAIAHWWRKLRWEIGSDEARRIWRTHRDKLERKGIWDE